MMRHPEHHLPPNQMQRDPNRMAVHRMPPPRGMMVGMQPSPQSQQPGVLVPLPGSGPALVTMSSAQQQMATKSVPNMAVTEQQQQQQQNESQSPPQTQSPNNTSLTSLPTTLTNNKEKTPMCLINELARYNKIQHQYRLTSEQGPAHKKRFTVTLKLGNEEYEAEGPSIKKAQHSAAGEALSKTQFKHPPQKSGRTIRPGGKHSVASLGHGQAGGSMLTPTVELNALAMKRGERTLYLLETVPHNPYIHAQGGGGGGGAGGAGGGAYGFHRNNVYGGQPRGGYTFEPSRSRGRVGGGGGTAAAAAHHYLGYEQQQQQQQQHQRYGGGAYGQYKGAHGYPHQATAELFNVILRVGSREYSGEGHTVQAARHNAASKALADLKQLPSSAVGEEGAGACPCPCPPGPPAANSTDTNGPSAVSPADTSDPSNDLKSPISLVHEIALKRSLNVTFEVLSEKGPPHMKVFITACKVGDLVAEGEGNGKKISKKRAAEKMLEELTKLPPLPYTVDMAPRLKRKRVVTKKKIRNLIKVNQEKSGSEYGEDINPISRLIQIQQASKEKEPTYTVIEERGAPRHREFVIEATVSGVSCKGTGPNKKLAKRSAAEALLERLGHGKPAAAACASAGAQAPPPKEVRDGGKAQQVKSEEKRERERDGPTEQPAVAAAVGGSGGRQLVPGLLLMGDQTQGYGHAHSHAQPLALAHTAHGKQHVNINIQQTATIAKEFLKAGASPTAEALATKAGGGAHGKAPPHQPPPPPSTQAVRSKDQLLYLAQLLGVQVQFSDFPKANHEQYLTLVSLSTTPPQVCHGEGATTEASHEKAALEALTVLSELGLDNVIPRKEREQSPDPEQDAGANAAADEPDSPPLLKQAMISNGLKK